MEANFHLDGHVSVRNAIVWGTERPVDHYKEKSLNSAKFIVWAAVNETNLFGSYFFNDGENFNNHNYSDIVRRFSQEARALYGDDFQNLWFQQDGATPHTAQNTKNVDIYSTESRLWRHVAYRK